MIVQAGMLSESNHPTYPFWSKRGFEGVDERWKAWHWGYLDRWVLIGGIELVTFGSDGSDQGNRTCVGQMICLAGASLILLIRTVRPKGREFDL